MAGNARVASLASDGRPLSLRVAYPFVGVVLALSLTLGLVAVRMLTNDASSPATLLDELDASGVTYAYVFIANASLLGFLGYGLGAREDLLWATSITDPLTQIANRRHFETALEEELERAQTSRMPLALLIADLDHLKTINDVGGHSAGDAALRTLADVIARESRARDLTARFGGDEFVIVMPRTRATEAWSLAERIRASLEIEWSESPHRAKAGPLTVSIGIADLDATGDEFVSPPTLFDAADRALYLAKGSGRDRAIVASQLDDTLVSARPQLLEAMSALSHSQPPQQLSAPLDRNQTLRRSETSGEPAAPEANAVDAAPAIAEEPQPPSGESFKAPGAAPTFCDETRAPCVSGMYDSPECESDRPRVGDVSGVRAVVDADGLPIRQAPSEAPRETREVMPSFAPPSESHVARAIPSPRESGAAPVYPITDRQAATPTGQGGHGGHGGHGVQGVEELIADTWDGWPEQFKRSS